MPSTALIQWLRQNVQHEPLQHAVYDTVCILRPPNPHRRASRSRARYHHHLSRTDVDQLSARVPRALRRGHGWVHVWAHLLTLAQPSAHVRHS